MPSYQQVANDVARYERLLDGSVGLLIEGVRTNFALQSNNFANTTWFNSGLFTRTPRNSIFEGQVAEENRLLNTSSTSRGQGFTVLGVFSGAAETWSAIVEQVDAIETAMIIYNSTAAAVLAYATFFWATETISMTSGVGTCTATKLATVGPNGGRLYRLAVTATGPTGANRQCMVYPGGVPSSALATILHHGQYEQTGFVTSPIITVASSVARANENLSRAVNPADFGEFSVFVEMYDPVPAVPGITLQYWTARSSDNTTKMVLILSGGNYYLNHLSPTEVSAALGATAKVGSGKVKMCARRRSDGIVSVCFNGGSVPSYGPRAMGNIAFENFFSESFVAQSYGHAIKFSRFPYALTDTQMQAITT